MKKKVIAIGGGVGPMAGVKLHELIIENTKNGGTDQGHLEVHHISRSHAIADRTEYLLGKTNVNPANAMFDTVNALHASSYTMEKELVVGVPCNTFHAPPIFDTFVELVNTSFPETIIVNMIEETGNFIKNTYPDKKNIGLMSTIGTRNSKVYHDILTPLGFTIIEVPEDTQKALHDSIYNTTWGIKAVSPTTKKARDNFLSYVTILKEKGAEAIILGCTEIPLALPEKEIDTIPLIDPMLTLARKMIEQVDRDKLAYT